MAPPPRSSSWSGWSRTASARIDPMAYGRRSRIESLSNPLVKRMRLLRDKRHRRAEGLFLAEGLRIATEAREAGVLPQWLFQIGRAHVCTPVTNAHLVCRLRLEKKPMKAKRYTQ